MDDTTTNEPSNILAPVLEPLTTPPMLGCFALLALLLVLSAFLQKKPRFNDARFATPGEVHKARRKGLRQIAAQKHNKIAVQLDRLVLPNLEPAVAVIGKSGSGKTRSFFDPALKSAIDQGWTNLVLDIKGNLMKKHAAYAHSKGYDVYVFAPGFPYSDGLNFVDFIYSPSDGKSAEQIATVLDVNFGEPGARKDNFFSPQAVALLKGVFMLAKQCPFPDTLSAWKILSLEDLGGRLRAAKSHGMFRGELNTWIDEALAAMRTSSAADETSVGIVASSMTHFQRLIEPTLVSCMLKSTIPLDLPGKQIVFFQIDEQAESSTAPLVATALQMLMRRNLNGQVKRDRPMFISLDEFSRVRLPDVEGGINLYREYGGLFALGYQSNAQIQLRYSHDYAMAILSSCGTTLLFNPNHPDTEEKFSRSFGDKTVPYTTTSRSYGKNANRNESEHFQKERLMTAQDIDAMDPGEAVIKSPGWHNRPYHLRIPVDSRNDKLWERNEELWEREVCPILTEQAQQRLKGISIEVEKSDREVLAECMLPSVEEWKARDYAEKRKKQQAAA